MIPLKIIEGPANQSIYYCGPTLKEGPLPAFFYFSLSGEESLTLDPYNQPVTFLAEKRLRVFSLTLPAHGKDFNNYQAMKLWAQDIAQGHDFVTPFVGHCRQVIAFLIEIGYIDPAHLGIGGLSRGGFLAAHVAAEEPLVKIVLGFAPLTQLEALEEFKFLSHDPLVERLSLLPLADKLAHKAMRFYIGNRDTCVGTRTCFDCFQSFAEAAYKHKYRPPPMDLIIYPSIGQKGHGTPPEIFQSGAAWVEKLLKEGTG